MIIHGDCLEELKKLEDNSIDAICCDPPYGLSFMGKKWDYDVPSIEVWQECLRVLKPGGYLLAFAGTRTQHRMAVRIEDAGFEIRDMIAWVYGSGFPKSLNIGKAVDKMGENPFGWVEFSKAYKKIVEESEYNHNDIDKYLGIKASSCYWTRIDHRGGLPPRHHWEKIKELLKIDDRYDALYDEVEREIIGKTIRSTAGFSNEQVPRPWKIKVGQEMDITKGTSDWEGWGTALKPALEPITVARKPLSEKAIANNVLKWGTGGINIDGCRVEYQGEADKASATPQGKCTSNNSAGSAPDVDMSEVDYHGEKYWYKNEHKDLIQKWLDDEDYVWSELKENLESPKTYNWCKLPEIDDGDRILFDSMEGECIRLYESKRKEFERPEQLGRFPANFIHSGLEEEWARYFYCAKASKKDRNEGLEEFEEKVTSVSEFRPNHMEKTIAGESGSAFGRFTPTKNNHPTVKPIALMEYLVKLVSREGAIVLDPFAGSGTTGLACKNLNRKYILIEREEDYIKIIKARLS